MQEGADPEDRRVALEAVTLTLAVMSLFQSATASTILAAFAPAGTNYYRSWARSQETSLILSAGVAVFTLSIVIAIVSFVTIVRRLLKGAGGFRMLIAAFVIGAALPGVFALAVLSSFELPAMVHLISAITWGATAAYILSTVDPPPTVSLEEGRPT